MSKINLSIFFLCSILIACVSSDSYFVRFWNGDYSVRNNAAEFDKERRIFYENEPQETKLLRVKNEQH